eukprot:m.311400 g.311400  ORF g.311400 m.311400 type:complete len:61 (-) comp15953_c0_seq11:1873-2055(-)
MRLTANSSGFRTSTTIGFCGTSSSICLPSSSVLIYITQQSARTSTYLTHTHTNTPFYLLN